MEGQRTRSCYVNKNTFLMRQICIGGHTIRFPLRCKKRHVQDLYLDVSLQRVGLFYDFFEFHTPHCNEFLKLLFPPVYDMASAFVPPSFSALQLRSTKSLYKTEESVWIGRTNKNVPFSFAMPLAYRLGTTYLIEFSGISSTVLTWRVVLIIRLYASVI